MTLRRQIFISFLVVAIMPLLFVMLYIFQSNTKLAFDLYQQNLNNSTVIQTDIIEGDVNRMMVRAANFASALEKSGALQSEEDILRNSAASDAILKFTEETLDSILVFTLLDGEGSVVYSSGARSDTEFVKDGAVLLPERGDPYISEITMGNETCQIAIVEPMKSGGRLIVIYRNDYLLKSISSHVQIEDSNAFFYCKEHNRVVAAKKQIDGGLEDFEGRAGQEEEGRVFCRIGKTEVEAYYKQISKTPWMLVNDIPVSQVYSRIIRYLTVNVVVFAVCLVSVVILSRLQSRRILQPMNWLLSAVEHFMLEGKADFSNGKIGRGTEVGFLAERFSDMASDMSAVQASLRESSYLYQAILHSSYEAWITIDYENDSLETSLESADFKQVFEREGGVPRRVMEHYLNHSLLDESWDRERVANVIDGRIEGPVEFDAGMKTSIGTERWYRVVAVPIFDGEKKLRKTVLHLKNITERKLEERRLRSTSQRDPLCGLLNKNTLIELVNGRKPGTGRTGREAVFFIDLDNFKQVNDVLGHLAGDEVLIQTAGVLKDTFRKSDLICRYGGDEFVVFVAGISRGAALDKADLLSRGLRIAREEPGKPPVVVTASVGICLSEGRMEIEEMISRADQAMYEAKQNGKSQYCITEVNGECD